MKISREIIELDFKANTDITLILQKEIGRNKGKKIVLLLPKGHYQIRRTILLYNNTSLLGAKNKGTKITLASGVNDNMLTNEDHIKGNCNIKVENIWLDGNAVQQSKPEDEKRLSFCNIFYFKNAHKIQLLKIKATNCKQTAMHFNNSKNIVIDKLKAIGMGWSGISTSGTDNIKATQVYVFDSGNETRHSAVHFDGGIGSYFEGVVEKCTGNGIMLDSKYSPFNKSVIKAKCIDCKRGIAMFGAQKSRINNVLIQNSNVIKNEIGILISNTKDIFVSHCNFQQNTQFGISLQGKYGNSGTTIINSNFQDNDKDTREVANSSSLYLINSNIKVNAKNSFNYIAAKINKFNLTKRF